MKKIITAIVFCFLCGECFSQAGEWVWIKGDSVPNLPGNFGVQGVPSPTNNPPSLYEPCEWTDLNGNFWLFGGSSGGFIEYGDLWNYDPTSNQWTWIKGTGTINDPGFYGVQGVPSILNNPPARKYANASWVDNAGNLWMFGGNSTGGLNDLWKYNILTNEWTWMKGSNLINQTGVYGTQGVSSPLNTPGFRWESSAAWTDNTGDLWLFGGVAPSYLNDTWRFNISSNQWTWMKGSNIANQPGIYGTQGIESPLNTPGARAAYSHWKDNNDKLWMFGGLTSFKNYNELWRFNVSTENWAWINGDSIGNSAGIYGNACIGDSLTAPSGRFENRTSWIDLNGNFWIFGGATDLNFSKCKNDLWMYCKSTNRWTWMDGDSIQNPTGSWNTQGVSNPLNKPDGRGGSVGWSDSNNHLYIFGGYRNGAGSSGNDLWKYTIDTACAVCPNTTGINENNTSVADELLVFPNPTNASLTISFQTSTNQNIELSIYNTLAKQIYFSKKEITKGKFEKEINVEKWSDGIYFLQLKMKDENISRKVMVSHP